MSNVSVSWTNPSVDTVGAPITITDVVLFRDGAPLATLAPATQSFNDQALPGGHVYSVRADTAAGVGTMSADSAEVIVPTGIAAAPGTVIAVLL